MEGTAGADGTDIAGTVEENEQHDTALYSSLTSCILRRCITQYHSIIVQAYTYTVHTLMQRALGAVGEEGGSEHIITCELHASPDDVNDDSAQDEQWRDVA